MFIKLRNSSEGEHWTGFDTCQLKSIQLWRYVKALEYIQQGDAVLDFGCGVGYGCFIMANKAKRVIGIDKDISAIDIAQRYWLKDNIKFQTWQAVERYNVIVLFEVLEHMKYPDKFLNRLSLQHCLPDCKIIITVPHISRKLDKWHYRHYTDISLEKLLTECGFSILESNIYPQLMRPVVFGVARIEQK